MATSFQWDGLWQIAAALLAGFGGGAINAIAGGGTNVAFPTLVWLGLPPISANATNQVGLWPGRVTSVWGFAEELATLERWWWWLAVPSLVGGAAGAYLLIHTPPSWFASIAPWMVFGSSLLLGAAPAIKRQLALRPDAAAASAAGGAADIGTRRRAPRRRIAAWALQLLFSVYGGYFGAGLGLMLLALVGLLGIDRIHQANGLKNLLGLAITGVAALYLATTGQVVWTVALVVAVGGLAGGWAGARLSRRVPERPMRWAIVLLGVAMAGWMWWGMG